MEGICTVDLTAFITFSRHIFGPPFIILIIEARGLTIDKHVLV